MNEVVFLICAFIVLVGSVGVIAARNPVHSALSLIMTLFGVAVLFLVVQAHFLAAIQVIVYAGAIVILFLFVIMLLGVDTAENLSIEPIVGQRMLAVLSGAAILGLLLAVITTVDGLVGSDELTRPDVEPLADAIFTDYVFAFEATGILLTVAVVGAVVMARRIAGDLQPVPEIPDRTARSSDAIDGDADADAEGQAAAASADAAADAASDDPSSEAEGAV